MVLVDDLPQVLGIASLQLKLILRKRFILVLLGAWVLHASIVMQEGRGGPVLMLLPTLFVTDLLVVVMACGLIADDADHGTFPFVLSHGIDRSAFLLGKLLPVVVLAIAFSVLAHTTTVSTMRFPEGTSRAVVSGRIATASGMSLVRILVLTTVTALMAVAFTNRIQAAMAALFYAYGVPYLLHAWLSPQQPGVWLAESILPWRDSFDRALAGLLSGGIAPGRLATSVAQPLIYAIVFGAIAVHFLRRRDLAHAGA